MFDANKDAKLMRVYGPIGSYFEDGISDVDVVQALDLMDGNDIEIMLKSDGGDVFEGISIYNQLKRYPGKVKITVDSIAASIASVIAMSADELYLESEHSMLMIHNPWTAAMGDATEFRSVADLLDKIGGEIASIYAKKIYFANAVPHFFNLTHLCHFKGPERRLPRILRSFSIPNRMRDLTVPSDNSKESAISRWFKPLK